jgi:hypothetical protein
VCSPRVQGSGCAADVRSGRVYGNPWDVLHRCRYMRELLRVLAVPGTQLQWTASRTRLERELEQVTALLH